MPVLVRWWYRQPHLYTSLRKRGTSVLSFSFAPTHHAKATAVAREGASRAHTRGARGYVHLSRHQPPAQINDLASSERFRFAPTLAQSLASPALIAVARAMAISSKCV